MFRALLVRHRGAQNCVQLLFYIIHTHTHTYTHTHICVCEFNYTISSVTDEPVSWNCMNLNFAFGTPVASGDVCAFV